MKISTIQPVFSDIFPLLITMLETIFSAKDKPFEINKKQIAKMYCQETIKALWSKGIFQKPLLVSQVALDNNSFISDLHYAGNNNNSGKSKQRPIIIIIWFNTLFQRKLKDQYQ